MEENFSANIKDVLLFPHLRKESFDNELSEGNSSDGYLDSSKWENKFDEWEEGS